MSSRIGGILRTGVRRTPELEWALGGIDKCRRGEWSPGLTLLAQAVNGTWRSTVPGLTYSFLGYGIALKEGRLDEGLALCRYALKIEIFEAENYLNLARTQLLAHDRAGAVRTVKEGLKVDHDHPELEALRSSLGIRRLPILRFLPRRHPINRALGRIRHALLSIFR